MPRFNLLQDDGTLDPLAPFKVLAIMCHPNNLKRREEMLALLHSETGHGRPRRSSLTEEAFQREVKLTSPLGIVAGSILLTRLQLHQQGLRYSLNQALPLISALLPKWEQPEGYDWSRDVHVGHHPHNLRKMRQTYSQFKSVTHMWAALIHGGQHDRKDICPESLETLPTFLAYANCILDMDRTLPSPARDRRHSVTRSKAWVFTIPEDLTKTVTLEALTLHEKQRCILNEHKDRKALN
jgi:hypothetical protein